MKNIKKLKPQGLATLLLILFSSWGVFAEQKLPVIKASSKEVKIKIEGQAAYDWYLMPEVKPDVFTLQRFFGTKHLAFVTDIDSISLQVKPDSVYNFMVLLNGNEKCFTQIQTLKAPVLLNFQAGLTTFLALILVSFTGYLRRDIMNTKHLLYLGVVSPLFFWVATICGGFIHGNYSHFSNVVSELGGIGRSSEMFMTISEVVVAVFCAFFSAAFYRASRGIGLSVVPSLLSFAMPVSMLWAAVFPMGHEWHGILGPLPLLINLAALLAFILWRKDKRIPAVRWISLLSFLIMMLIATRFLPQFEQKWPGLVQRFFYLGWSVWYISVAVGFIKILNKKGRFYR